MASQSLETDSSRGPDSFPPKMSAGRLIKVSSTNGKTETPISFERNDRLSI